MLNLIQGDSIDLAITISLNNSVYDITGCKIWFTAKVNKSDPDESAALQLTTDTSAITITNGPAGQALISITPTQSNSLPLATTLFFDIQIKTTAAKIYTVYFDTITMTQRITDAIS